MGLLQLPPRLLPTACPPVRLTACPSLTLSISSGGGASAGFGPLGLSREKRVLNHQLAETLPMLTILRHQHVGTYAKRRLKN